MNCSKAANSSQYRMTRKACRGRTAHNSNPALMLSAAGPMPVRQLPATNSAVDDTSGEPACTTHTQPNAASAPALAKNQGRSATFDTAWEKHAHASNAVAWLRVEYKNMSDTTEAVSSAPSTHTELE